MGSIDGCRHTWHDLRRVRDLPIISVWRYMPVLGPLMRIAKALAPDVMHLLQHTPTGSASPNPFITRWWQRALAPV
jgi:hypothetical protein